MGTFLGGVMLDRRTYRSRAVAGVTLVAVDVATDEVLPTLSLVDQASPSPVTTNGDGAYSDFYIADRDIARLKAGGVSQVVLSAEVLQGQARSLAPTVETAADLPAAERDGSLRITQDDLHLHLWRDDLPGWEDLGPLQGAPGPPGSLGGLTEVSPGAYQVENIGTGWVDIDITDTTGSIRDPAAPGTLRLRRDGDRVTARLQGVGLAAGSGAGFLLPNVLPSGYEALSIVGPAVAADLGGSGSVRNRHRVHVTSNDIYWCGWSNSSGVYADTRVAGVTLQGEITWITDDPPVSV